MAVMQSPLSSGVTEKTPESILLGAGTIHKGLKFTAESGWNFKESIIGATSGGSKITITPSVTDIELDGVNVKAVGLAVKQGETATLETNISELTPEVIKWGVLGEIKKGSEQVTGYDEIKSKAKIESGDYIDALGWVGKTVSGREIIIIFDKALCTSGMEIEGKAKDPTTPKMTFECYADITGDLETLPYHIYYPTAVGVMAAAKAETETPKK